MATTKFKGTEVNLSGTEVNIGDEAPVVIAVDTELNDFEIGGKKDQIQLIISVPSLDTSTCAAETRRFNMEVGALDICATTVISMDLPFASSKFCSTEGIDNLTVVSDYVGKDFGNTYGVLMADNKLRGLLARTIFVINRNGEVVYKEIVSEVTEEPDYDAVLEAIKEAR